MKNEETLPLHFRADRTFFIHHFSFCISAPSLSGAGDDARYFQNSVPVQPGNSGGALVDERGNVVGVVAAKPYPCS